MKLRLAVREDGYIDTTIKLRGVWWPPGEKPGMKVAAGGAGGPAAGVAAAVAGHEGEAIRVAQEGSGDAVHGS